MDSWHFQLLSFFALCSLSLFAYWFIFHRKFDAVSTHPADLAGKLIGRRLQLESDLCAGQGKARIDDADWVLRAEQQLAGGTQVEVVATDGMTLVVKPYRTAQAQLALDVD